MLNPGATRGAWGAALCGALLLGAYLLWQWAPSSDGGAPLPAASPAVRSAPPGAAISTVGPAGLEIARALHMDAKPAAPGLVLAPGACQLLADAEGNVEGNCVLPPPPPATHLNSPFGTLRWAKPDS